MKEWNQEAVKAVIKNIQNEIKYLEYSNCYHCKDFPFNSNSSNDTCKKCRLNKQYKIIQYNERLLLWKNRLIEQEEKIG